MSGSAITAEIAELRTRLDRLEALAAIHVAADDFLSGDHAIRSRDFVRFDDGHAARVCISGEGKWTYTDRNGRYIEPFRVPPEEGIERLYTIAEVAEILARVRDGHSP